MRLHDRVLGLILIGLAGLLGFHSANLTGPSGYGLGPGLFPNLIALGIAACGLLISLKARNKPGPMIVVDPRLKQGSGLIAVSMMPAGVIFYVLVIDWFGFMLTAAIMIALLSIALGASRKASLLNAILGSLLAYGLFAELLRVPLATGSWLNYFRGF
ncbi:MAG: hypothetical protein RIQ49_617 [Pseudomonadota bacterium]|jgi:putative tricarboxylic transport membrane protein